LPLPTGTEPISKEWVTTAILVTLRGHWDGFPSLTRL
jgi:hypothetical protein